MGEDEESGPTNDWEVAFARDVLLSTTSARRSVMLKDAATVVDAYQKQEAQSISEAFSLVNVDWRDGDNRVGPKSMFAWIWVTTGCCGRESQKMW